MKNYDERCYDLAAIFLGEVAGSTPEDIEELAQAIQDTIEGHCNSVEARAPKTLLEKMEEATRRPVPYEGLREP